MFLLDQDSDELVATVFDGITTNNKEVMLHGIVGFSHCIIPFPHQLHTMMYHGQCGCIACVCSTVYGTPVVTFPRQAVLQAGSIIHFLVVNAFILLCFLLVYLLFFLLDIAQQQVWSGKG